MHFNRVFALLSSAALLFLSACGTKEEPVTDPEQTTPVEAQLTVLSGQVPVISDAGDSFTVEFSSSLDWEVKPLATWVIVTPSSGEAGEHNSVTVEVLQNRTYNERSSRLVLSCGEGDNMATAQIPFTQKQKGALILSQSVFHVDSAGELITITVKASSEISFEIEESATAWITEVDPTKVLIENTLQFQIAANEDYDPREGIITFTNGTDSEAVTVKQVAKGALIISDTEVNVGVDGELITVKVQANSDVSYAVEESATAWITPVPPTKGLTESEFQFQVAANEDYDPREGSIVFTNESGSQAVTVKQVAKGALLLSQTEFNVGAAGEVISITVQANSEVSAAVEQEAASWITLVPPTKGLDETVWQYQIAANEDYDPREGTITFSNEAGDAVVTVHQAANGALFVEPVSFEVGYAGEDISFTVQASSEVTVTVATDASEWIVPIETKGLTSDTYQFQVAANASFEPRSGVITVSSNDGEQEVTVSQEAAPSSTLVEIASVDAFLTFVSAYNAGDYKQAVGLQVSLTSNLAFDGTSSAAFNATGGIGLKISLGDAEDYYFSELFDGGGKTISGLEATVPLFKATGSAGVVKNLTLDSSCSFTYTHPNTAEGLFGSIVAYHKGLLENVSVAADITLAPVADVEYMTTVGGLVGRATVGQLSGCTYSGLITAPAGFTATAPDDDPNLRKFIVGGLVGRFTNAGSISGSYFKGAISNEAQIGVENDGIEPNPATESTLLKRNPFLILGGVVGHVDGEATVTDCHATADHADVPSAHTSSSGKIVNKTAVGYFSAVGGIVGEVNKGTVSGCTNAAMLVNTIFKAGVDDSRYIYCGGIVGKNNAEGSIQGCTNNATVQHRSNPKIQDIGGIAGYNAGSVSGCVNTGAVNHSTTGVSGATKKGGRVVSLGGVIGENTATAVVTNIQNSADIEISAMEDGTKSEVRMGGLIAYNLAAFDGGASKSVSSGKITFSPNFTNQFLGYYIAGGVGYTTASVSNVKSSSYIYFRWNSTANVASKVHLGGVVGMMSGDGVIAGCENMGGENNAGEVYLNVASGAAKHTDDYVGGVLGKGVGAISISNCSNSGYVHGGNATKQNGTSCYVGGVAAYLEGAASITGSTNSGIIYNNHFSNSNGANNTAFNGGIAGWVSGTAESPVTITGCSHTTAALSPRRGYNGGIVGYANYASVENCNVGAVAFEGSAYYIGGIAGWVLNSTITGCAVDAATINSSQIQRAAGVVAKLGDASTLDGCQSKVASIIGPTAAASGITYVYGAVAGETAAGSTIKDCHYPATGTISAVGTSYPWQLAGDTNFTDGGGNAADL